MGLSYYIADLYQRKKRLAYSLDAMIPIEIVEPSTRMMTIDEENNETIRRAKLHLIEEEREKA